MLPQLTMWNTNKIMEYTDFQLAVDTEPDINDCMWVEIRTRRPTLNDTFDMSEDCVRRLRDACNEFLANLEAERESEQH